MRYLNDNVKMKIINEIFMTNIQAYKERNYPPKKHIH